MYVAKFQSGNSFLGGAKLSGDWQDKKITASTQAFLQISPGETNPNDCLGFNEVRALPKTFVQIFDGFQCKIPKVTAETGSLIEFEGTAGIIQSNGGTIKHVFSFVDPWYEQLNCTQNAFVTDQSGINKCP